MMTEYLKFVLGEMSFMFDAITDFVDRQMILAATMCRFLGCESLLDLSETYSINKDILYKSIDAISPARWFRRLRKKGRRRLLAHLRKWQTGNPSYRSRHAITLCADDFTRTARGGLGEWSGLFYSGAAKRVVNGINIEALVVVIGDGDEVIILDVRIVPPPHEGPGRKPLNQNQWLRRALRNLDAFMKRHRTHLCKCNLSVDAAYVSPENVELVRSIGMHMVGKLSINRRVKGPIWGVTIGAPVKYFAPISLAFNPDRCRELRGEKGVEYQRNVVNVKSLKCDVLMLTFIHGREFMTYFSTHPGMKAITLRNILRFRWQIERIFWILKQDIGIGDIHHQKKDRVETRIYLHFILAQATRDAASEFNCSPKDIVRAIRRSPERLLFELGFPSAFAMTEIPRPVPKVRLVA